MQAIYLMAIGGALGYALGAVTSLVLLSQSSATYNSQKPAASQSST